MINLSSKELSPVTYSALSKGLSFVPTTGCNDFNTIIDLQKFFRNLRLKEWFKEPQTRTNYTQMEPNSTNNTEVELPSETATATQTTPFRGKSTFIPPKYRNSSLDTYCRLVERDVTAIFKHKREYKVADNLNKEQRDALNTLKQDTSVVIQSADKGGAIVILDRTAYDQEVRRQLSNTVFYQKLNCNPTKDFKTRIHTKLNVLQEQNMITKKEHAFMTVNFPTMPVFYILPKIHKAFTDVPTGRPIISAIGSLTENISAFIDYFLQPLTTMLPSYTKDSMDFIEMIKSVGRVEESHLLVTMDIESLYTNVPFEGGLRATEFFLNKRPETHPSTQCLLDLTKEVLTSNAFMYDNDFFLQISGVAMGSKMSPSFASLYVGLLEHNYIYNHQENPFLQYITNWKRYLDDVFFIWTGPEKTLNDFHTFINSKNEHLKFTMEADKEKMNFLDIMVIKVNNVLKTDLYRKPTDRNSLLHGESYHPVHLKRNLPISQFSRIRRICSSNDDFTNQSEDLEKRFRDRGYNESWINDASSRFKNISQVDCLRKKKKTINEKRIVCAIQYSPVAKAIEKTIKQHWHILNTDPTLQTVFHIPPRVVFKKAPNLRNKLVRADLPPVRPTHFLLNTPKGNYPCGRCQQCHFTYKTNTFSHPHTGKKFYIKDVILCSTTNVIYLLTCPCGLCYVGKTTRALKTRISEHRSAIRNCVATSPVAQHFMKAKHNVSSLKFIGLETVKYPRRGGDLDNLLLKRELFWIYTLETLAPRGLNEDFDIRPFLG